VQLEWRLLSTGALLRSVPLPTADALPQRAFAVSGSATSEGLLASTGTQWTLVGYAVAPGLASVSSASGVARVVARVSVDGGVDTSTAFTDAYAANNVRAAATSDGTGFWLAGTAATAAGVRYAPLGSSTSVDVASGVLNIRAVKVFQGQLYASTAVDAGAGVPRVFAVGQGLPVATTAITGPLAGVTSTNNGDFVLLDVSSPMGPDRLYVADTVTGGVRRFALGSSLAWAETAFLRTPSAATLCIGVAAKPTPLGAVVLCSGANGSLYQWVDEGLMADGGLPEASVLLTAPAGTVFRGLAFE